MSTLAYTSENNNEEMVVLSNDEFDEMYPAEFFAEANYYEDEDGNLIFQHAQIVTENSSLSRSKTTSSETTCVSDNVMLFDLTTEEKNDLIECIDEMKSKTNVSARSGGGDSYKYNWDTSGACKAFTRVYYTTDDSTGAEFYDLTKVTGGFSGGSGTSGHILGSGVTVTSQTVRLGQTGKNTSGTYQTKYQTYDKGISTRSWSQTAPSWAAVNGDVVGSYVGATLFIDLKRGTDDTTWSVTVKNNVVENAISLQ